MKASVYGRRSDRSDKVSYYRDRIAKIIREHYPDAEWAIEDDSQAHRGHATRPEPAEGKETHLRLRLSSEAFNGLSPLEANRRVLRLLSSATQLGQAGGLHALSLTIRGRAVHSRAAHSRAAHSGTDRS